MFGLFSLDLGVVRVDDLAECSPCPFHCGAGVQREGFQLVDVALVPVLADVTEIQGVFDPDSPESLVQRDEGGFEVFRDGGPIAVIDEETKILPSRRGGRSSTMYTCGPSAS